MADEPRPSTGRIVWCDLTVPDAPRLRDFYAKIAGWSPEGLDMGGYEDYSMLGPDGSGVAGVCHARGVNAAIPPQWLIYVEVPDLEESVANCIALGGSVVDGPRPAGDGEFCVIRDPAGAVCALIQSGAGSSG